MMHERLHAMILMLFSFSILFGCKPRNDNSAELAGGLGSGEMPPQRTSEIGDSFFAKLYGDIRQRNFKLNGQAVNQLIESSAKQNFIKVDVISSGTIAEVSAQNPRTLYAIETPAGTEYIGVFEYKPTQEQGYALRMSNDPAFVGQVSVEGLIAHPGKNNFEPVLLEWNPNRQEPGHLSAPVLVCAQCHTSGGSQNKLIPSFNHKAAQTDSGSRFKENGQVEKFKAHVAANQQKVKTNASIVPEGQKAEGQPNRAALSLPDESLLERKARLAEALKNSPKQLPQDTQELFVALDTACGTCHGHVPDRSTDNAITNSWFLHMENGFRNISPELYAANNGLGIGRFIDFAFKRGSATPLLNNPEQSAYMPAYNGRSFLLPAEKAAVSQALGVLAKFKNTEFFKTAASGADDKYYQEHAKAAVEIGQKQAANCYKNAVTASTVRYREQCITCCGGDLYRTHFNNFKNNYQNPEAAQADYARLNSIAVRQCEQSCRSK